MSALTVLTLMISLYCLYLSAECRTVPLGTDEETFQPLCSRKCSSSSEQLSELFPRYKCSCSRSCTLYGDCCYDSPYKHETSWQQFDFICLSVMGRGQYRAVSSCPPNKGSGFCKEVLGHLPPVTSRVTNITYGNVFCASCNEDAENLMTWNVELKCLSEKEEEMISFSTNATRIIYHRDEFWKINEADRSEKLCKFHVHYDDFRFLDELELRPCTTTKKVSECSPSWRDIAVREKCRSYEDPVYFHDTAFRNSHCAQCNYLNLDYSSCIPFYVQNALRMELIDRSVVDFCKDRGSVACILLLSELSRGRTYSLTELLNISETECVPPEGRRCCSGKRYDYRTGRCRKVSRG